MVSVRIAQTGSGLIPRERMGWATVLTVPVAPPLRPGTGRCIMAKQSRGTLGPVTLFFNALSLGVESRMRMVADQRDRAGDDSPKLTNSQGWERWENLAFAGVLEVRQRLHTLATDLEPLVSDAPRVATRIGLLADRLFDEWLPMVKPGPWTEAEAATFRALHAEVRECVAIARNASHSEEDLRQRGAGSRRPPAIYTTVVLWEGAEHTAYNIRLARTRSAYLEAHGDVEKASAALDADGHAVARSTFYNHLDALDQECPGWRNAVLSPTKLDKSDVLDSARIVRNRQITRGTRG